MTEDYASVGDVERAIGFKCGCHLNQGQTYSLLFSPQEMVKKRDQIQEMPPCKWLAYTLFPKLARSRHYPIYFSTLPHQSATYIS